MAVVRMRRMVDDKGAEAVIRAAEKAANEKSYRVVIAIVDPWGELIQLRRTKGAQIASSRVAVDKARTAAIFIRPSREIEEQVTNGRLGALTLHGVTNPVVLEVTTTPEVKGMFGETRRGFSATTKIHRKDYGLTWNKLVEAGPAVGDEVTIALDLEVVKDQPKTASK